MNRNHIVFTLAVLAITIGVISLGQCGKRIQPTPTEHASHADALSAAFGATWDNERLMIDIDNKDRSMSGWIPDDAAGILVVVQPNKLQDVRHGSVNIRTRGGFSICHQYHRQKDGWISKGTGNIYPDAGFVTAEEHVGTVIEAHFWR